MTMNSFTTAHHMIHKILWKFLLDLKGIQNMKAKRSEFYFYGLFDKNRAEEDTLKDYFKCGLEFH